MPMPSPDDAGTLHVASAYAVLDGVARPACTTTVDGIVTSVLALDDVAAAPAGAHVLDAILAPAPIDIHFHGAGGLSVAPGDDPAALGARLDQLLAGTAWHPVEAMEAEDAKQPATSRSALSRGPGLPAVPYRYLATLPIPARPPVDPVAHLAAAHAALAADAHCVGIRLEGTFINPARAGVWPPEGFHPPDLGLLDELVAATGGPAHAGGALRIVDVAPELPGALALVARAREHGIVVAVAHTDATHAEAVAAFDAGATLATHTFNAMRPFHHREPGVAAAALVDDRVTCELVCDGLHVHPGAVALAMRASGPQRTAIVSDASPFAGQPAGRYSWQGLEIVSDGISLRDAHGNLAGAALLVPGAVDWLLDAGFDPVDVAISACSTPLRVLDPARPAGLAVGDRLLALPRSGRTATMV